MGNAGLLLAIREQWLTRVFQHLPVREGVRESFEGQLTLFYDRLVQAVDSNDPASVNSILDEWAASSTETELRNRKTCLAPILSQLLSITFSTARETLGPESAANLLESLLPVYAHAVEYAFEREVQLHVAHVTGELEKARSALERLDRSKSDFIAVAAHELKTPLTLIDGYAAMLREVLPPETEMPEPAQLFRGIGKGTRRLREIVEDMIDVSLIDNQLLALNFQPVWLSRLLAIIDGELRPLAESRNQTLTIHRFPGSNELTFGDGERLYQALKNVISNAVKYTPDGGKITVDGRKLPGFVEIIVSDDGIGIHPEDQLHIFEKFGRIGNVSLHSSGKTKFKGGGPGLGLPIAKGIIEAHGGTIWVESEGYNEEKCPGSKFHILLPLRTEPPDDKMAKLFRPLNE